MQQGSTPTPPRDSSSELLGWTPGARIGDHVLEERLGAGGMGAVFAARHVTTGARRAVKVLLVQDPELRERFRREGEAMARVGGHPHVARVHAAGEHRGRPYLVVEHLGGGDLDGRLRRGPLPPAEAVALTLAVAEGLAHVHAHGVLHRDLKPANILFDEQGCPKLVDFGLARRAGDGALTRTGELVGTPSYMAPEQADGRHDAQGVRTDVYGLGAVLYHALAGRPPFDGTSLLAVLEQVLREPPRPPSALAPRVPRALDDVVLRALAKRPEERYPSVTALADALASAALDRRPPPARRVVAALSLGALLAAGTAAWLLLDGPAAVDVPAPDAPRRATTAPAPAPAPASVTSSGAASPSTKDLPPAVAAIPLVDPRIDERWRAEVPGLAFFALERLGEPDSGVAVQVAREVERVDPRASARLYRWAVEHATDPVHLGRAWLQLADLFSDGAGVPASHEVEVECERRAAAVGHAEGLVALGHAHDTGAWGLTRDLRAAVAVYRRALDAPGDRPQAARDDAAVELAKISLDHPDLFTPEEAEALLTTATRQEATLLRGRLLERRGAVEDALTLYDDLARRRDHPEAHLRRARLLLAGAPERADDLLQGPDEPLLRAQFAWHLWDDFDDLPGARPRALAILRQLQTYPGRASLAAGLNLARIRRDEHAAGVSPTCVTAAEALRLIDAALGDPALARDAHDERARWKE